MSAKHTPGPWAIDWNVSRIDVFSADAATLVATIRRSTLSAGIDDVAKANARLIAAAPELLEALKAITAAPDLRTYGLAMQNACIAIARAEGVQS